MTDLRNRDASGNGPDDRVVARLIRLAGRRRPVPAARAARVRAVVHAEWRDSLQSGRRERTRRRAVWTFAAAAVLVLGVGLTAWQAGLGPWATASPVAGVEAVRNVVRVAASDGASRAGESEAARIGMTVRPGTVVETGADGLLALRFETGHSVRLDRATRLRVSSADRLELQRGAVYVDSGTHAGAGSSLSIDTAFGSAREIGTQFEVRLEGDSMRLRVREGAVDLWNHGRSQTAHAGVELTIDANGELRRGEIPFHGLLWDWVLRSAPAIDIDGASLETFLAWASRETGLTVVYMDAAIAESAPEIALSGSIDGLTPEEALAAVLPTCGLTHRIERETLVIDPGTAGGQADR